MNNLEQKLAEGRQLICDAVRNWTPDTSEGMAWIFEDTLESKPVGLFTLSFAKRFCEQDSLYVWRKA